LREEILAFFVGIWAVSWFLRRQNENLAERIFESLKTKIPVINGNRTCSGQRPIYVGLSSALEKDAVKKLAALVIKNHFESWYRIAFVVKHFLEQPFLIRSTWTYSTPKYV